MDVSGFRFVKEHLVSSDLSPDEGEVTFTLGEKKLYTFVEVDDKTPVQKLSIADQFRVILKKITEDPANELANEDAVTRERLTLKANLTEFLRKSVEPIKRGTRTEVIVEISNIFDPVLDEVLKSKAIRNYYDVDIARPHVDYNIPLNILLRIKVKKQ